MKKSLLLIASLLATAPVFAQQNTELKTDKEKASYSIGLDIGGMFKKQDIEIEPAALMKGVQDGASGAKPLLTEEQMNETRNTLKNSVMEKQNARFKEIQAASEKFLAENKGKEGVKTTASGLQYKAIKEGTGANPKATDTVKVHYRGTLIDGTEFDSSYARNEPIDLPLNQVIPGWTEGIQLMKVGSKYQFFIPSNLGYGERGSRDGKITPNAALIFDVELLGIGPSDDKAADAQPGAKGADAKAGEAKPADAKSPAAKAPTPKSDAPKSK